VKLAARLVVSIALASVLPLAVLGGGASTVASNRVLEKTADLQGRTAEAIAVHVDTWLDLQLQLVAQQVRTLPISRVSEEARGAIPRLILEQTPASRLVMLISRDGRVLVPSAHTTTVRDQAAAERALLRSLHLVETVPVGLPAASAPYTTPDTLVPSMAVAVDDPSGARVAVELSLESIARRVGTGASEELEVAVLGADGAVVLGGGRLVDPSALTGLLGGTAVDVRYTATTNQPVVAALAPVDRLGWTVVVAEPVSRSAAALREIRLRTAYIAAVSIALALVVGALLSRQLAGPVVALKDAALHVADGDYGRSVHTRGGSDELGELARAFNHMSDRLREDAQRIRRQQDEIAAFNEELQERVDARTRELEEAQDRLVQSARLAAVGEMGAGMAHELNNPIAGILGLSQVLLSRGGDSADAPLLRSLESQARRCREIVGQLLGLSRDASAGSSVPERIDVNVLARDVFGLVRGPLGQRGVTVDIIDGPAAFTRLVRTDLGRALAQILSSISAAVPKGGQLSIRSELEAEQVVLVLTLVAPVIDVGGDDWRASGLGFWGARRTLRAMGGQLVDPGVLLEGSGEWRIVLPRDTGAA